MKKSILLLAISLGVISGIQAQSIGIGAEAGVNLANLTIKSGGDKESSSMLAGLKLGGIVDIGLGHTISLQPGIFYIMKGAKDDNSTTSTVGNTTTTDYANAKVHINYLEIPVNLEFKFAHTAAGHFFAGAGPYLAFALGGKSEVTNGSRIVHPNGSVTSSSTTSSSSLHIGNDAGTDEVKGTDVGVNINLGYQMRNGLFVRGNAGFGLANIAPGGDANNSIRNWGLSFSLGYMF